MLFRSQLYSSKRVFHGNNVLPNRIKSTCAYKKDKRNVKSEFISFYRIFQVDNRARDYGTYKEYGTKKQAIGVHTIEDAVNPIHFSLAIYVLKF